MRNTPYTVRAVQINADLNHLDGMTNSAEDLMMMLQLLASMLTSFPKRIASIANVSPTTGMAGSLSTPLIDSRGGGSSINAATATAVAGGTCDTARAGGAGGAGGARGAGGASSASSAGGMGSAGGAGSAGSAGSAVQVGDAAGADKQAANMELQRIYRTSVESHLAHATYAAWLQFAHTVLSISILLGSTASGLLLLVGTLGGTVSLIGGVITWVVTSLLSARSFGNFAGKASLHQTSAKLYSLIAREVLSILTIKDITDQAEALPDLAKQFEGVSQDAPSLPPVQVLKRLVGLQLPLLAGDASKKPLETNSSVRGGSAAETPTGDASGTGQVDEDTRKLIEYMDLEKAMVNIDHNFSFAIEKMPPIPRPLPANYEHIRGEEMLKQAAAAAPMNGPSPQATSPAQRRLKRLASWYERASEYAILHRRQSQKMEHVKSRLQIGNLVVATGLAIALLVAPTNIQKVLSVVAGIISACVGLSNSWLKFAAYEKLEVQHEEACIRFTDVAFDIDVLFTHVACLAKKGDPKTLIDQVLFKTAASSTEKAAKASTPSSGAASAQSSHAASGDVSNLGSGSAMTGADIKLALGKTNVFDVDTACALTPMVRARPSLKLQLWLRQSCEHRIAHSLVFDQLTDEKDMINFVLLIMATTNSVILMLGSTQPILHIAAIISALVTALTGITRFNDYDHKLKANAKAAGAFTSSEQKLTTLLVAHPEEEYDKHVIDVAAALDEALRMAPVLPPLKRFKAEDGSPLFEFITADARWKTSKLSSQSMSKLASK